MKVLVCLLSPQHVPNLLSVHHFQPDRLVLVETPEMERLKCGRHFREALRLGGIEFAPDALLVERLNAEDSVVEARDTLQRIHARFPEAEWIANITGGTKPMGIAAYEFFRAVGGKLVYTNVSRPATLIDLANGGTTNCNYRLGIREFLAGYGFEARKPADEIATEETRAKQWTRSAVLLAQHASDAEILSISDDERKRSRERGIELSADRMHFPNDELRSFWLEGAATRKLTKYEARFLTGGWLEVFLWNLLTRHAEALKIWDVRLGLEIARIGDQSGNDYDVSFMEDYGLSVVECKSGSQDHDLGGDVLYKVEAVTKQFRALKSRSILVTTGTNIFNKSGTIKESLQTRADIYRCRILTAEDIQALAGESVSADDVRTRLLGKSR